MGWIVLAVITIFGLLSCAAVPTGEPITIEFWTIALGDAFADYVNGMIDAYERAHPGIRIKWVDVSGGEVAEKFLAAVVGGVPPDLANLYDLPRFMQYGALRSMDDMVPEAMKARWIEGFWKGVDYQGVNYALPWYAGVNMMWYNREIFEAAGLDPNDPPETIDEMLGIGRVIHRRTGKCGVSWRLDRTLGATAWVLLRMEDVWPLFNEDFTRTTINRSEALAFFEKWIRAYQDGVFPPEAIAASHRDDINWFIEGRAAMFPFSGGWITRYFDQALERKVVPAPNVVGRLGKVPAANQVLVVPKNAPHPEEAQVMLPLVKPALATQAAFTFVAQWNDFLWPLVVLKSRELYTLQLGLASLQGVFGVNWRYISAASIIVVVPTILFFILTQRFFLRGLTAGAVKG